MRANSFIAAAAAAAAAGSMALAGCSAGVTKAPGANGPSVASLITSLKSGFATASSVQVSGSLTSGGKHVSLALGMLRNGDESGTMSVNGTDLNLTVVGGKAYEYVTKAFFKTLQSTGVPASACATICGKYISIPATSFSSFNLAGITKQIESKVPVANSVPHIKVTTYEGEPAYEMYGNGPGIQIYVAKNGTHYLLGMVDPAKFGTLNFSKWNQVPPVTAPPASKIVNAG